ncbi:MvaI/BcnI family restriction endonuclease [Photobacterium damselae]
MNRARTQLLIEENIYKNKIFLTKMGVEFSLFEPTLTGLKKSILDATYPVRTHFELENFHNYKEQGQGPEYKITHQAFFIDDDHQYQSKVSLYRPKTKKGDPRMWFTNLKNFVNAGDVIAIVIHKNKIFLLNLTVSNLSESYKKNNSCIKELIKEYHNIHFSVSQELLNKLKAFARTPFPALKNGDTALGYTLETMLGIPANSNKQPDYHGIELKSGRGKRTRTTLFAQVADWNLSPYKKSSEILDKYGYQRDDDFKLYCTVSTQKNNTQGLQFIYNEQHDQLEEWYLRDNLVAIWPGELLRNRLKEKHAETFWIEAKSEIVNEIEMFQLVKVTHTQSPILSQLVPLIQNGIITMDHLIKRNGKTGKVSEKGPLFKMNKHDLPLLFPEPITYSLV